VAGRNSVQGAAGPLSHLDLGDGSRVHSAGAGAGAETEADSWAWAQGDIGAVHNSVHVLAVVAGPCGHLDLADELRVHSAEADSWARWDIEAVHSSVQGEVGLRVRLTWAEAEAPPWAQRGTGGAGRKSGHGQGAAEELRVRSGRTGS
jgi:hypothetical protein